MRLSVFILHHLEKILEEWQNFAKTLTPAANGMTLAELRDHAKLMLEAVAADIETEQTPDQETRKSKGLDTVDAESAAATHGTLRQDSGFSLMQLTSEFRALRASVLRLWLQEVTHVTAEMSADMLRFNEAIDQALAESAVTFSERTDRTRDTFLAILGHDLRSPLQSMVLAGDVLSREEVDPERRRSAGRRVSRSAATMTAMVNDLLEYARTQLGGKMPIIATHFEVGQLVRSAVDDAGAAHPKCPFELQAGGECFADVDGPRIHQVLSNLLNNAAQYRAKDEPVVVRLVGHPDDIEVQVCNRGPGVPPDSYESIFQPLVQLPADEAASGRPETSVGLGLFIAREITVAHGGSLTVGSNDQDGTVFTMRVPRRAPPPEARA